MTLDELLERPDVTEVCELRGSFGLMAFHGGNLERTTDAIAAEVAERTRSSYYGVLQEAPLRKHLPSTSFDPAASAALRGFFKRVDTVIAVHGYGREAMWHHLLVGGRNRELAAHVSHHLREVLPEPYEVIDDLERIPRKLRGQHRKNPVNQPVACGVQLELPPSIRWNRAEHGWSDHHGVSRAPDVVRLIDGLTQAVHAWS